MFYFTVNFFTINSSPPEQNGRHFTDDIFKCILNWLSLKFVSKGLISIGSDNGLAPIRRQAIIWINAYDPAHWRIYAALKGD